MYNQIMDYLSKDNESPVVWKFNKIIAHQGPLSKQHKDYKVFLYNVTVEWENGEQTDEPLSIIAEMTLYHLQFIPKITTFLT